jgi:two-component system, chemotaxis family, chemotaxis protein CheY
MKKNSSLNRVAMAASRKGRCFRILLIEDDAILRSSLGNLLRGFGHDVEGHATGRSGLVALRAGNYDVVITDVFMPEVDGVAIARAARKHSADCRIIGMSGGCARISAALGLQMVTVFGADKVLYKPFSGDELIAAMTFETVAREKEPPLRLVETLG